MSVYSNNLWVDPYSPSWPYNEVTISPSWWPYNHATINSGNATGRLMSIGAELLLGQQVTVLDKGYVTLVDYLGSDQSIVRAARHSYDRQDQAAGEAKDRKLINYLMSHSHSSPFEQCSLVFEVKAPIFVFREWHRHRTAKLNECSARYTELPEEYYVPALNRVQAQSTTNKQGSGAELEPSVAADFCEMVMDQGRGAFEQYHRALKAGVSRELARIILPFNTYSKMVWQCDLHNLLGFLKLRTAEAAQFEIRQYALAIQKVVKGAFPWTWEAYEKVKANNNE